MSVSESAPISISSPQARTQDQQEIPTLATLGEYTVHPMEYSAEEDVAKVFSKICQRGNPVLQGRPVADLILLGRAMYRKANLLRMGQVVVHKGEPVALAFSWDVAEGGVWRGSGLERPASMDAHAACGGAAFDSLAPKLRGKTFFSGFFGVLPPHDGVFFGYLAVSSFFMAKELGFQDGLQFTLLPTLNKRAGVFEKFGDDSQNLQWDIPFEEVAAGVDKAVAEEILQTAGRVNISLTNVDWALYDEKQEWLARAAATVRLSSSEEMRRPAEAMGTNQVKWMRQTQSSQPIASRL